MSIYQYCLAEDCGYTAQWEGGSAADDPSLDHLRANPDHTVRSGANEYHEKLFKLQRDNEFDVTPTSLEEVPEP